MTCTRVLAALVAAALVSGAGALLHAPRSALRAGGLRRVTVQAVAAGGEGKALIIQNKGGGHGELGFHLANILVNDKQLTVTMIHDGGPAPKTGKDPWDAYPELEAAGVEIIWADLEDVEGTKATLEGKGPFEYVFDNWSKDPEKANTHVNLAKGWEVSNYVFVSSAGMYKSERMPMVETDDVKESGQRKVELLLDAEGLPWTVFRPQYIYGPKTNKRDYLDYFLHRVNREVPIPIPYDGDQRLSITHAEDVATLLSLPIGNPDAVKEVFNCGSDEYVTYDELCLLAGKAAGKPVEVFNFKPEDYELPEQKGNTFPFRKTEFIVGVDKARSVLGFAPKHNIKDDLKWYYEDFLRLKCDEMTLDWHQDENILASKI